MLHWRLMFHYDYSKQGLEQAGDQSYMSLQSGTGAGPVTSAWVLQLIDCFGL